MNRIVIVSKDLEFAANVERQISKLDMWEVLKFEGVFAALHNVAYGVEVFIFDLSETLMMAELPFKFGERHPDARLVLAIEAEEITDVDEDGAAGFVAVMLKSDADNILEVLEEVLFPDP